MQPMLSFRENQGMVIPDPENFAKAEHRVRVEARCIEQSFVADCFLEPFVFCNGPKIKPSDGRRQRFTLRINRYDRFRQTRDGDASNGCGIFDLSDPAANGSTGCIPDGTGFKICPVRAGMRSGSRFGPLSDDGSGSIQGQALEVSGSDIESENQVVLRHTGFLTWRGIIAQKIAKVTKGRSLRLVSVCVKTTPCTWRRTG